MDDRFGSNQGYGHDQFSFNPPGFEGDISGPYGPDGFRPDDRFGSEGRFGPDAPPFRDGKFCYLILLIFTLFKQVCYCYK